MLVRNANDYYDLCQRIAALPASAVLAIDTETTGLRPWLDTEIRGVSLAWDDNTSFRRVQENSAYVPLSHPGGWNIGPDQDRSLLRTALRRTQALHVYHNAGYDMAVLERGIGLAPRGLYRDTQQLAWLIDENQKHGLKPLGAKFFGADAAAEQKSLKALMRGNSKAEAYKLLRCLGFSVAEAKERSGPESLASKRTWGDLTAEEIGPYAEQDAVLTFRLYDRLLHDPEYLNVLPAVQRQHDVTALVYQMTKAGIGVVPERIETLRSAALQRIEQIRGVFPGVNLDSPKQLARLIYDEWDLPVTERTDSGQPSTSRETLEAMSGMNVELDVLLEFRRLQKAVSGFYDQLLDNIDPHGRVHASVNVCGTVTGRFSYSDPNLQQIPKVSTNKDAKTVFVARPGYELWSFDLQSAELRVAASLTNDTAMQAALDEPGRSFHKETARAVFGKDVEPYYTLAKNLNYGIPYGIGPKKFAWYLAKGLKERPAPKHYKQAKAALNMHAETWVGLHQGIHLLSEYAEEAGRVPLHVPGRYRHFWTPGMAYPVPSYHAINAVVQGGVAEFMKDMMLAAVEPAQERMDATLVLQVHDSLVFEVPAAQAPRLHVLLQGVADDINPFRLRMLWDMKRGV